MKSQKIRIISSEQVKTTEWAPPASWGRAFGILRGKKKAIEKYLKKSREEWDRRIPYDD